MNSIALFIVFHIFSASSPHWVYIDNYNRHFLFEKKGGMLVQGGVKMRSFSFPYSDSIFVRSDAGESMYRGMITVFVDKSGKLIVENKVKMDDALYSIVNSAMSKDTAFQFLKLKAVLYRTLIAYKSQNKPYLKDSTAYYYYGGIPHETPLSRFAVRQTHNIVILFNNSLIYPYFCLSSGGITASPAEFEKNIPYIKSIIDTFCVSEACEKWKKFISFSDLKNKFGIKRMDGADYTLSGRIKEIYSNDPHWVVNGETFADSFDLPSLLFTFSKVDTGYMIEGRGVGKGLGLSLESASLMIDRGLKWYNVLAYFYNGTFLKRLGTEQ